MKHLRLFLALTLLSFGTIARSADAWTLRSISSTRANLWGVAYDGTDRMVAVGEQGTILVRAYSADAGTSNAVFSPRLAPTSVWLTGVGYGNQRWVTVGDLGVILSSDDGGDTWTARTSGTIARLNAVAYGNNRWLAVGEAGTVLTSPDGITWNARPALGSGFFRGLAFGQGQFVFGGASGSLYTTADAVTFTSVPLATTANIEGVAISENRFWVVGSNGLLATAPQLGAWTFASAGTTTVRAVVAKTADQASAVGDSRAAAFTFASQTWSASVGDLSFLATAATVGQNEVIAVGFGAGVASATVTSNISVTIVPPGNAIYGQDLPLLATVNDTTATAYQWLRDGIDVPGATRAEFVLPANELINFPRYRVRATTPSGNLTSPLYSPLNIIPNGSPQTVDPDFKPVLTVLDGTFVPQPDGKILVFGNFSVAPTGGTTSGIARLNHDGSLDLGFRAGEGVARPSSIFELKLMADGRIYVRGNFTSIGGMPRSGLARLLASGAVDPTFVPDAVLGRDISSFTLDSTGRVYLADTNKIYRLSLTGAVEISWDFKSATVMGVDRDGRLLVTQFFPYAVYRFFPDGTRDSTYAPGTFRLSLPATVVDNQLYSANVTFQGVGGTASEFLKINSDGTLDEAYRSKMPRSPYPTGLWTYKFRDNGSVVMASDTYVRSYDTAGNLEPFYAAAPDQRTYLIRAFEADGSILAQINPLRIPLGFPPPTLFRIRPITGRPGRLTNLSVRAYVSSASDPLLVGFVASGTGNTSALVRAIGPSLAPFGVTDAMSDPRLTLLRDGATQADNDNWPANLAARFAAVGAFALNPNTPDAALESPISSGNYTAVISPATGGGTALAEVYESADPTVAPRRFVNISARNRVSPERPLIVGFSITGDVPATVLVRGTGPALTAFGVTDALPDPQLKLYRAGTPLWENDNWPSDATLIATTTRVGAFPLTNGSKDASMLLTLPPGSYTAVISAPAATSGSALVEVYEVPNN